MLASGQVNTWTGGEIRAFEREFAAWCGSGQAIAMAIAVVHLGGWPADMPAICDLAQAHGARLRVAGQWQSVGGCGDVGLQRPRQNS